MVAAEVIHFALFFVIVGIRIGRQITDGNNAVHCLFAVRDNSRPSRVAQKRRPFANHKRIAQAIPNVGETNSAVMEKNAFAGGGSVFDVKRAKHADVVTFG